jgi:hypothetical protein
VNLTKILEDDSRKDAKHAKYKQDYKFETRNPKFETISNGQKLEKCRVTSGK